MSNDMTHDGFWSDSVEAIAARVRAGDQSARSVTEQAIARIEALDPIIRAFVAHNPDDALAQADQIDALIAQGVDPGPLAGVPVGVKDLEAVAGYVTTFGSDLRTGDEPATSDSVHVSRYRAAGAVIIGKTNTPEYGHKGDTENVPFGQTNNPWDIGYSPGGSSGGTAAAIAASMIPLGTGSDGGGSIRIPASICGLSGLKTTTGTVPISGRALPGSGLLSCNGPMGRTALDSAIALDAVAGPDPRDPLSLPRGGGPTSFRDAVLHAEPPAKVLWCPDFGFGTVDAEVAAATRGAVEQLAQAGTEIVEVHSIFAEDPVMPWLVLWAVARFKAQGHLIGTPDWDRLSPSIQPQIMMGSKVTAMEFAAAQDAIFDLNWQIADALDQAPLILAPTIAGQVPRVGSGGGMINGEESPTWVQFTYGINLTRHPAGSVPVGLNSAGLPIGLQVIGAHRADAEVLAAMAAMEQIFEFDAEPSIG